MIQSRTSFRRLHQEINLETIEPLSISRRQKWKNMLRSVSFWSKISVMTCIMAVSMDPLFFYIPYLDHGLIDDEGVFQLKYCLGMEIKWRNIVLIFRSLTDLSFIVHIICEILRAKKTVASMSKPTVKIGGRLNSLDCFDQAKAISKTLSWSSIVTDFLAVLPIPHVFILVLFYSPNYGYSENKMTLNGIILAQYLPRMYRIFLSFKKFRKNSSMWLKATFYFFMYLLAGHVIGAFWYFSTIQSEARCWYVALEVMNNEIRPVPFRCIRDLPLDQKSLDFITEFCPINPVNTSMYDFGLFSETLNSGYTQKLRFREKLFYFAWWGLKNLSNFGTNLENSLYIWENCFGMLITGVGLVLFSMLIGNMEECFQSAEEKKVIRDKVHLKGKELQVWMDNNGLLEKLGRHSEKLGTDIRTTITHRMEEDKDAALKDIFSLIPWDSMTSLKCTLCMSMLTKVPLLKYMDKEGLILICHYLKPVTYNERTIVYRTGEPLDSMLLVVEGIMVIYADGSHPGAITSTQSTIHGSLENGGVYGPISKGNVKCLSLVEGFLLSAKDLKTVVSKYPIRWSDRDPYHIETDGHGGEAQETFYLERTFNQ